MAGASDGLDAGEEERSELFNVAVLLQTEPLHFCLILVADELSDDPLGDVSTDVLLVVRLSVLLCLLDFPLYIEDLEFPDVLLVEVQDEVFLLKGCHASPALWVVEETFQFPIECLLERVVGSEFDLVEVGEEGEEWGVIDIIKILHSHRGW